MHQVQIEIVGAEVFEGGVESWEDVVGWWELFQSLVVMKISERGMPDSFMAAPTAGSVP